VEKAFQDRGRFQAAEKFLEIQAIPGISPGQFLPGAGPADRGQKGILAFGPG